MAMTTVAEVTSTALCHACIGGAYTSVFACDRPSLMTSLNSLPWTTAQGTFKLWSKPRDQKKPYNHRSGSIASSKMSGIAMIAGSSQPMSDAESVVPSWSSLALELELTTKSTGHGRRVQRVGVSYLVDKTQV